MKKEQQKKGKKAGAAKKKDDKSSGIKTDEALPADDAGAGESMENGDEEKQADDRAEVEDIKADDTGRPGPTRKISISTQSKQRSESFRQGSTPMSPQGEVQDLYRKQEARIDELEQENSSFRKQQEEGAARLAKAEEELESLREGSNDKSESEAKTMELERLQTQLSTTQRQLSQAQQSSKGTNRRTSGTNTDFAEQIASKTSVIESLELEVSNLRNQVNGLQGTVSEREAVTRDMDDRAKAAESATDSVKQELDALKVSIAIPSDETQAANEDPEALTKRITILESDLRTAHNNLDAAAKRATSLEQKIEALTKLHRDTTAVSQSKDKELSDLRNQLRRRDRASHVRDASEFELGEEETETGTLHTRIRALEAENFDLRRGVWKDKRAELQPGIHDDSGGMSTEYEDVDLNGPYSPQGRSRLGSEPKHSTFQDVFTSGISAFTGRTREPPKGLAASPQARKQSLGLLSEDDDDDFDPDAFRLAQEEEGKRRIERVKEVKRGLEKWRGWRVDLVEVRSNNVGIMRECGPVFEV